MFLVNKDEPGHVYHGQARFRYLLIAPDVLALTSIFDVEILQSQQIHPCGLIYRADFFAGIDNHPWLDVLFVFLQDREVFGRSAGGDGFFDFDRINNPSSYLFDEPNFLLQKEVTDIGSYFSILRIIAAGNHKPGCVNKFV